MEIEAVLQDEELKASSIACILEERLVNQGKTLQFLVEYSDSQNTQWLDAARLKHCHHLIRKWRYPYASIEPTSLHHQHQVQAIIDRQFNNTLNQMLYLVRWKGDSSHSDTWETAAALQHQIELVQKYDQDHPPQSHPSVQEESSSSEDSAKEEISMSRIPARLKRRRTHTSVMIDQKKKTRGRKKHSQTDVEEYVVEAILGHRNVGKKMFYQIKWKGYSNAAASWEPSKFLLWLRQALNMMILVEHLEGCQELVQKYHSLHNINT